MQPRIIIAADSFKEALPAREVCDAIAAGARRALPDAAIECVPMADGGEGTVEAMTAATGGTIHHAGVSDPLGRPVEAAFGLLGNDSGTAVLEMAAASGLALVPPSLRNPLNTSTFGTGELILAALDAGARGIILGIGGSATNDGGTGAAQAVGVKFVHRNGQLCRSPLTGGRLHEIGHVDLDGRDSRIGQVEILVACDVDNSLCGPRGAAAIYGPQKGATPEAVSMLDDGLSQLSEVIARDLGVQVRDWPGAGAAGGLGAGLVAFFGAKLCKGVDLVANAVHLAERVEGADLVITGEGRLDRQSMMGKVIAGVGRIGKAAGIRVIALVGCTGEGAEETLAILDSFHVINPPGTPPAEAIPRTAQALEATAHRVLAAMTV